MILTLPMKQTLKLFALLASLVGFSLVFAAQPNHSSSVEVPVVQDMSEIAKIAREKSLPIMLVFSADHCPYCEILENEIIKPMIFSGDYTNRALIYKINIDDSNKIIDFDGEQISNFDFASNQNAYVTPTMVFLDPNGKELYKRILGVNTVEMFGGRVDQALAASLNKLRSQTVAKNHSF